MVWTGKCKKCKGKGEYFVDIPMYGGTMSGCENCQGTGKIWRDN